MKRIVASQFPLSSSPFGTVGKKSLLRKFWLIGDQPLPMAGDAAKEKAFPP